jgi:stearoyl-CoA desaturase (delta-9 desaturase)
VAEIKRDKTSPLERLLAWGLLVVPAVGFVAAIAYSALVRFSWVDLALCGVFYVLTALGITMGFHRLFTHRSFQAHPAVKAMLAILGDMAVQGPTVFWVASHRRHHRYSDVTGDPHSPRVHADGEPSGFWHAHVGWTLRHEHEGWKRYVPDLLRDPIVVRIDRVYFVWVLLGLALPAAIGGLAAQHWQGAVGGLLWGGFARIFLWHHATYSINSVCHLVGDRPFQTTDTSTNNLPCALLTLGEGWHNNHHAFPASARHGLWPHQIDMTYMTIRALERVGLASAVIVPDAEAIAAKAAATVAAVEAEPEEVAAG